MSRTVVFFHAHPDDEVLLTGGTMARLASEGHRVVLVTATLGEAGLAATAAQGCSVLGEIRSGELRNAAATLGCSRVVTLGFTDSGDDAAVPPAPGTFCDAALDVAADRLARILREERADAVTIYDPAGGYGHRDHIRVHDVGRFAAAQAATKRVFEATVDRQALQRALRVARWFVPDSVDFSPDRFARLYTDHWLITHRVDVRRYAEAKRAALAAHASQTGGGNSERTLSWLLRLPLPLFRFALGYEWYVERGRVASSRQASALLGVDEGNPAAQVAGRRFMAVPAAMVVPGRNVSGLSQTLTNPRPAALHAVRLHHPSGTPSH